ncbi:MAG: GxxExxY protein, partial [Cyclobacteriaceae bacterium]|nr:GxxExxY protein [Cyclobacteriaceae bacterium]
ENQLSKGVIGCALNVHKVLGPGLLESAYKHCLCHELIIQGLQISKEEPMPIVYHNIKLDHGYRIDILVEDKLVIEVKAVDGFVDVHLAQVLTYLRLGSFKLGLLLNFNVTKLKHGIKRVIL